MQPTHFLLFFKGLNMFKRFLFLAIFIQAPFTYANVCPYQTNVEKMHHIFFKAAYRPDYEQSGTFLIRQPEKAEAEIAWSCLSKAVSLEHCNSMYLQALFYEYGIGEQSFGIKKSITLAKKIKHKMKHICNS